MFEYTIRVKDNKSKARVGEFNTSHGKLHTPELAFVATEGEIKCIPKEILPKLPAKLIIVNTFHIWVKNIIQTIDDRKSKIENNNQSSILNLQTPSSIFHSPSSNNFNIHNYANFPRPIMSDSGGFQVFSMGFGKAHGVGKVASMFPEESRKDQIKSARIRNQNNSDTSDISDLSDLPISSDFRSLPNYSDINNPLTISEEGVEFIFNGEKILLTPEKSMEIQQKIGADIMFAFDECTSPLNSKKYTREAMERTHRWVKRCIEKLRIEDRKWKIDFENRSLKLENNQTSNFQHQVPASTVHPLSSNNSQALFAIIQGGYFEDLRKTSAKYMAKLDVPGYGIGGSLGKTKEDIRRVLDWTIPHLPEEKPRHLLGIGQVRDIFEAVEYGVDLFDCVIPTREARHRVLYTKKGKINVRKMKTVNEVIDKNCSCQMCLNNITMEQLNNLFSLKDPRAFFYATVHNIQFYSDLTRNIREAIKGNAFFKLKNELLTYY